MPVAEGAPVISADHPLEPHAPAQAGDDAQAVDDEPVADQPVADQPDAEAQLATGAPAVVAVVVTRNPGDWFEATLSSLEDQDYEELSVLVVDNGSLEDPTPRVAEVAPGAFVKRVKEDRGFSLAANEALHSVQGAPFLLICHDDVRLPSDAVTQLVAEAFRANAGIVGPKFVDWDDPRVLRSVGYGVDTYGAPSSLVDPGELDQSQHDIARPVFAVSDACMLVRADLFATLGGFHPRIDYFGEDVDLCWRTQLAGATVQFCPRVAVAHREDFASRRPSTVRDRLALRHQTRSLLTNYRLRRLVRVVPAGAVLSVLEAIGSVLVGRAARAGDVLAAWGWALTHLPQVVGDRRRVKPYRRVQDSAYLPLMRRGSTRIQALTRRDDGESRLAAVTRDRRERWRSATTADSRLAVALAVLTVAIFLVGARGIWFGALPSMREFTSAGSSVRDLLGEWWHGYRASGLGESAVAPGAVPGLGVLGAALATSVGAARRVLLVAPLLFGAIGAWRLFGATRSLRARAATTAAYAVSPIALNAMGEARLQALLAWAVAPWLLARLARHGGLTPMVADPAARDEGEAPSYAPARPPLGLAPSRLATTAISLGVVAAVSPLAAVVATVSCLAVLVGPALSGQLRASARAALAALIALCGAAALNGPWIVAAVRHGDAASLTGLWQGRGALPSAVEMLTGSVGDLRTGLWGWGLVLAAAVPLITARRWRFGWALGGWLAVLGGLSSAVLAARADLVAGAGVEVFLVAVALGLAVAIGMAPLAFETDVVRADFGLPQLASFVGVGALGLALVPLVVATSDGRWYLPDGDFGPSLDAVDAGSGFRTLWIGDPDVLPMSGWELDSVPRLSLGLAEGMTPVMSQRWRLDGGAPVEALRRDLAAALEGRTVRLGQLLAPMSIRYVVVVDRPAPEPFSPREVAPPDGVVAGLEEQLDLSRIAIGPGVDLFEVTDTWAPRTDVAPLDLPADGAPRLAEQLALAPQVPEQVLGSGFGTRFDGELADGAVVAQAVTADPGWSLRVDGESARRRDLFGWGQQFEPVGGDGGEATLGWGPPTSTRVLQGLQVAVAAVLVLLALRRGSSPVPSGRRRRIQRTDPTGGAGVDVDRPLVVLGAGAGAGSAALGDWRERPLDERPADVADDPVETDGVDDSNESDETDQSDGTDETEETS